MSYPAVDAVVELVAQRAPGRLHDLRARYPGSESLLAPGKILGDKAGRELPGLYCELARIGLEVAELDARAILLELPRKAQRAKCIRLVGSVVAAVTSAGVISSAMFGTREITITTAMLSFVATLASVFGDYVDSPLFGSRNLGELIEDCLNLQVAAQNAKLTLEKELRLGTESCAETIVVVNGICAKLRRVRIFGSVGASGGQEGT